MESRQMIEIAVLAVIAIVVLARLYSVLGQKRGSERPTQPLPHVPATGLGNAPETQRPQGVGASATPSGGMTQLMQMDSTFDVDQFLKGARGAYEIIVKAFADGDVAQLQTLLTPRVHTAYAQAIAARAEGDKGPELVRLRAAEIDDVVVDNETARVMVRFEAELAEGAHGIRETKERWTFERNVRSRDPNWLLAGVAQA